jgi:sec-independent protein translocase protein TatC
MEIFYLQVKIVFFFSLLFTIYYFLYQALAFFYPAFYTKEQIFLKKIFVNSFFFSFISFYISLYHIIPIIWLFFMSYQQSMQNIYFEARLNEYFYFVCEVLFFCMFYSQISLSFFIYIFLYKKLNVVILKKYRKMFYYFLILFNILVTPPDLLSQTMFFLFLFLICELIIFLRLLNTFSFNKTN